uniref:Plastocyanin-like domain n=1 Tax=Paeonia suffruticosa TaxID=45171 RepID=A0AB38Z7G4_PAESU
MPESEIAWKVVVGLKLKYLPLPPFTLHTHTLSFPTFPPFSPLSLFLCLSKDKSFGGKVSMIMPGMKLLIALVIVALSLQGEWVEAQIHHVVGGDRGWDPSSDVASWSSGRIFMVGDKIWFTYSAAQESIVELKSKEEYESCDISNPIRMYTDGLDSISLDGEGIRYFTSSKSTSCKNGLKLHVDVQPYSKPEIQAKAKPENSVGLSLAAGPTTPSGSTQLSKVSLTMLVGLLFPIFMGM